jgi:alpha-ribazole phosphatase/probable phosphoglycerate mutase
MLTVYLLRHGQTTWNADNNRYCGRTDISLTEIGVQQALSVKQQLEGISFAAVYASPLQRASTTAELASGKKVITDQRLIEVDFGQWEKKTREEFVAEDPTSWERWDNDPANARAGVTGETGKEVITRVDNFFQEKRTLHEDATILVAAHNGVNRLYLAHKLGMPLKNYRQLVQHNSAITKFTLDQDNILTLEYLNSKLK